MLVADVTDYRWYQADPVMYTGETIAGIRFIAPSKLSALTRAWAYVAPHHLPFVTGFDVNEIHDSILALYNLNSSEDYEAFLQQERG
jgi:hypothetical protein